jgi:hypothetical protein
MRMTAAAPLYSRRSFLVAMWLSVCILLVQMVAMGFHHHDLAEVVDDCPSCHLGDLHPTPAPPAPVAIPVPVLAFVYHIAVEPVLFPPPGVRSYLSPYPQAPPRISGKT